MAVKAARNRLHVGGRRGSSLMSCPCRSGSRGFVPMSAMFVSPGIFFRFTCFVRTLSCTQSQRVEMCLVLPTPDLLLMPIAAVESHSMRTDQMS